MASSSSSSIEKKRPPSPSPPADTAGSKRSKSVTDAEEHQEKDASPQPVVCLAVPYLGPAEAMEESLDILFACIQSFLQQEEEQEQEQKEKGGAPSLLPSLEIILAEEAAGKYAAQLQQHADALSTSTTTTTTRRRTFRLHLGQLSALKEETLHYAQVIACPCDHRLLPSDHPCAGDVFKQAGPVLANTAKLLFHKAAPGKVYPVKLTASSPLRARQGVEYVLLTMPPCGALATTLPEGWQEALRASYMALIQAFVEQIAAKVTPRTLSTKQEDKEGKVQAATTATTAAAATATTTAAVQPQEDENKPPPSVPTYRHPGPPPQSASWQGGLQEYLQHATALRPFIFMETSQYMVIYDGYPKARVHLLLMPKPSYLAVDAVTGLRGEEHLDKLTKLHADARRIAAKLQQEMGLRLRLGYHSIPSLQPLHLHIISQDFDSPSLKTKKHWQSFTSSFFLDAEQVEAALRGGGEQTGGSHGRVLVNHQKAEALLKQPLHCHGCGTEQKNMPTLKTHITQCRRVKEKAIM